MRSVEFLRLTRILRVEQNTSSVRPTRLDVGEKALRDFRSLQKGLHGKSFCFKTENLPLPLFNGGNNHHSVGVVMQPD
jgi:hypothetical protein